MKHKNILLIIILLVVLSCVVLYISLNNNKTSTEATSAVTIDYDENDDDIDFSNYEETLVDLNNLNINYTITTGGIYHFTGSFTNEIIVNASANVKIILDNVTIVSNNGPCIYVKNAKNTVINLIGNNTLTDSTNYNGLDDEVKATIFSKDDLIFEGNGTLNINANYEDGIVSKDDLTFKSGTYNITSKDDGIRGTDSVVIIDGAFNINAQGDGIKSTKENEDNKGYVLIKNGNFNITAVSDGIEAITNIEIDDGNFNITTTGNKNSTSCKGIKSDNSILINNITITLNTTDDSVHSNNIITINNGDLTISSGDDGIHADNILTINANINILKSYEGLESHKIIIDGGNINILASDDGINASGGDTNQMEGASVDNNDIYLKINAGTIIVNSSGDGLDSNGSIYMLGGNVIVYGPTSDADAAIDYNNTFELTGGNIVAFGSSGMAQNISSTSSVYSIIVYFTSTQTADTTLMIDGIGTYTSNKNFTSVVIASSNFQKNNSYTLNVNGTAYQTFTINNILTTIGTNNSRMGGNNNGIPRR